jgi:signal transduction histidine kinase
MRKGPLARLAATRYARAVTVTLLALAAGGQAIGQAVTLGGGPASGGSTGLSATLAAQYVLPLSLLALLATVPLAVYRPVMAAVAVTFGNAVALASFGQVTAAGVIAELTAACWLGLAGGLDDAGGFRRPGGSGRDGSGAMAGRYLATGLGLPFLGIALARGGWTAVLLAAAIPVGGGTGIAAWAGRLARTGTEAGQALADTLLAHTARGERARIARELHDVVAHHISMIAVLAETGRLATPGLPEAGARRFLEIGDTARAGLTEMRRLLGVLREDAAVAEADAGGPDAGTGGVVPAARAGGATAGSGTAASGGTRVSRQPQPGLAQLTALIDAAREASVAGTRLIISGLVTPLDPGVELAAYRIVQEALTNARRHAPGAAVDVELRYGPESLRVRVRDSGPGPRAAPQSAALTAGKLTAGGPATAGGLAARGGQPRDAEQRPGPDAALAASKPGREGQGGGHGVPGMRERAFSVGGALQAGAAPGGGFLVEAVLPSEPDPVRAPRAAAAPGTEAATAPTASAAAGTGGSR